MPMLTSSCCRSGHSEKQWWLKVDIRTQFRKKKLTFDNTEQGVKPSGRAYHISRYSAWSTSYVSFISSSRISNERLLSDLDTLEKLPIRLVILKSFARSPMTFERLIYRAECEPWLLSTFCSMWMLITYGQNDSDVGVAVVSPCGHGLLCWLQMVVLLP